MPKVSVVAFFVPLRGNLAANCGYIAAFNSSALRLDAVPYALKVLPIDVCRATAGRDRHLEEPDIEPGG